MSMPTDFKRRFRGTLQFRLRTLLLSVTLCGAALAVMNAIGPVWSVLLAFMLLLAAMHVIGNAVGTRLNDEATASAGLDADERPNCPAAACLPEPPKRLAVHAPLGKWIAVLTAMGVAGGGTLGERLFSGHATHAALIVGTISFAVLGGFATFIASSFLRVGLSALWQAHCGKPTAAATRNASQS